MTERSAKELWDKGREKIQEVVPSRPAPTNTSDYDALYVGHLFGEIWTRPELSIRDRRLIVLGALSGMKLFPKVEAHLMSALEREELTPEQAHELVITVSYYVGYPVGSLVREIADRCIERLAEGAGADTFKK